MRERAVTTSIIWIALVAGIDRIVNGIGEAPSSLLQVGLLILVMTLIIAAAGATVAIWQNAAQKTEQQTQIQAEKAKRDHRDARLRRLLETMDDDDLDLLEGERLRGEEDRLSLEALLRKRDSR